MISRFALSKIIRSSRPVLECNRSFIAAGGQYFRVNDNTTNSRQSHPQDLPSNIEEVNAAEKSTKFVDRSREMSGQQTSSLFSSGFMVGQYEEDTINDNVESKSDTHGYDMVGNAQLNSVVESHVPEPFSANDEGNNLKEGIPEGLSEMGGMKRWTMEDRMEHSHMLEQ